MTGRPSHPLVVQGQTGPDRTRSPSPNSLAVPDRIDLGFAGRAGASDGLLTSDTTRLRVTSHDAGVVTASCSPSPSSPSSASSAQPGTSPRDWSRATIGFGLGRTSDTTAAAASAASQHDSASSPSSDGPSSQQLSLSKTYHSLSYAPRQRQSILRTAHPVFQSHSSQFSLAQQASSSHSSSPSTASTTVAAAAHPPPPSGVGSFLSSSPSFPSFTGRQAVTLSESKLSGRPQSLKPTASSNAAASAALALVKMELSEMKEGARQLGLDDKSAGWMILEALQAASEGEWATIASLVASGEATMLLPREPPSVFSSGSRLSLSFAHDHLIFNEHTSAKARPSPASLTNALVPSGAAPSFVTLSGLRGQLRVREGKSKGDQDGLEEEKADRPLKAVMRSFVPRAETVVGALQDATSRREMLDGLAPLPVSSDAAFESMATLAFPTFELGAYRAEFPLPPPLQSRRSHARTRTQSSSRLNVAESRASASFASLFGGSGRERNKGGPEETLGSELVEAARLTGITGKEADQSGTESPLPTRPSSGPRLQSEGHLGAPDEAADRSSTDTAAAKTPERTATDGASLAHVPGPATATTRPERTISVWVVDRVIRRSSVLRAVGKIMAGRIVERLRRAGVDAGIIEVVSSFSAMFVPPAVQASGASLPGVESAIGGVVKGQMASWSPPNAGGASLRSPTRDISPVALASVPYLAGPDEMSENFQDFFASLRSQLESVEQEKLERKGSALIQSRNASLQEQQASMDRTDELLEVVESAVTQEVYDRIFCPPTSKDEYHDDALTSRIAALNVLGLSLSHLGLDAPADGGDAAYPESAAKRLDDVVAACGEELQKLQSPNCRSPKAKLEVLVAAHRVVVDGLSGLPGIRLKEDANADDEDQHEAGPGPIGKTQTETRTPENSAESVEQGVGKHAKVQQVPKPSKEKEVATKQSSADLILPLLIYSIVSANPPKLASNLFYIQRFRAESLVRGETTYCLVNVQAAVAFLENVDVKDLGLDASRVSAFSPIRPGFDGSSASTKAQATVEGASSSSSRNAQSAGAGMATSAVASSVAERELSSQGVALSMPLRLRGRLTQEIGDLAGISNKVITGVMGSSISAFGRVMGAGMAVSNETWEKSRADGPKTLDEVKRALSNNRSRKSSSASAAPPRNADDEADGKSGVGEDRQDESDARSMRSAGSSMPLRATAVDPQSSANSSSSDGGRDKPSIGDRLASLPMLGRAGSAGAPSVHGSPAPTKSAALLASPVSGHRELSGPPPPQKPAVRPARGRMSSKESQALPTPWSESPGHDDAVDDDKVPASLQSPYAPLPRPPTADRPLHVVLACTGSVASVKVPSIVVALVQHANVRVQVVPTASSLHFFDRDELQRLNVEYSTAENPSQQKEQGDEAGQTRTYKVKDLAAENLAAVRRKNDAQPKTQGGKLFKPRVHLWTDEDEWVDWKKLGDPVLHIELRRWADIVLVAPCSANTLAKINGGICDGLLLSFLRALSSTTPKILFPAMNTLMHMHPLTSRHNEFVKKVLGYEIVGPIEKKLACGDFGTGAMYEWSDIVQLVVDRFGLVKDGVSAERDGGEEGW